MSVLVYGTTASTFLPVLESLRYLICEPHFIANEKEELVDKCLLDNRPQENIRLKSSLLRNFIERMSHREAITIEGFRSHGTPKAHRIRQSK